MIIGTNWIMGYSHQSRSKDRFIKKLQTRETIADIVAVFLRAGVDTILGVFPDEPHQLDAIRDAEDRTGRAAIRIGTPHMDLSGTPEAGDANRRTIEEHANVGCRICMPHQSTTDVLVDRRGGVITDMEPILAMIRQAGMIPGLSTHMPETPIYADNMDLDVSTYIQIYNAAGFLMQVEVDWVHKIIWGSKKPVLTIKPLAAGRLAPLVGLAFSWATVRPQDMVAIGCMTADEAQECIEISLGILDGTGPSVDLQTTRSKKTLTW
jgi:hypothetical protein